MYFKYKIDLGYKIFNIMPKRKRDETKKTAVEIAAHLDFTKISDGKTFYKEVCRYFAESCGKSRLRTQNRDEDWWRNQRKNRVLNTRTTQLLLPKEGPKHRAEV